jgi:hypothetical protein
MKGKWFWHLLKFLTWPFTLLVAFFVSLSGTGFVVYLVIGILILLVSRLAVELLCQRYGPPEMQATFTPGTGIVAVFGLGSGDSTEVIDPAHSRPKYPIIDEDIKDKLLKYIPANHRVRIFCRGRYFYDLFTDISSFLYARGYNVEGEVMFNSDGLITPDTGIVVGKDCTTIYLNSATQGAMALLRKWPN